MAAGSSRLAGVALILIATWIAVYWATPAPDDASRQIRVSRGAPPIEGVGAPDPTPAEPAPVAEPPVAAPEPESIPPELVPVSQEELERFVAGRAEDDEASTDGQPEIIPPTFRMHTVERGDTYETIAKRYYGSTRLWRVVSKANSDLPPEKLRRGMKIRVPLDPQNVQGLPADGESVPELPEPDMTEYIVAKGDTLSEIAQALYGRAALWRRIVDANPGLDPDRLRPGMVLKIPPPPAAGE